MVSERLSNIASAVQTIASVAALGVSIWALVLANGANQQAKEIADKQGDYLVMQDPIVDLVDPVANKDLSYEGGKSQPVYIPADAWTASPPDRRTLTVTLRNVGQQDAHLAQPGLLTGDRPSAIFRGPYEAYEDTSTLAAVCSDGPGPDGPCPNVLAAHDAVMMRVVIPEGYIRELDRSQRDAGIEFSLFVGGDQRHLKTGLVLPAAAFGG